MSKLDTAIGLFDQYNQQDSHTLQWKDKEYAAEYFYALQLYNWVRKLEPDAGEHLLLAARAQHIGRWQHPRSTYPEGKAGYLTWRKDMAKFHAKTAGDLMLQAGYTSDDVETVSHIILKENLKKDEEVQVMENALCLVFLQFQYEDFITKHDDQQVIHILKKTWAKMTDAGREHALELPLTGRGKKLIESALQ